MTRTTKPSIKALCGYLVVGRTDQPTSRSAQLSSPTSPLGDESWRAHYRGFEGLCWPELELIASSLERGLIPRAKYNIAERYFKKVSKSYDCDLIYIQSFGMTNEGPHISRGFSFYGYDYGYYSSEYNKFSILYNEIIFGRYNELRVYQTLLNRSLLLPSIDIIEDIRNTRDNLIVSGADLEVIEEPDVAEIIVIYGAREVVVSE